MRSRTGRRSDATGFVAAKRSFAYLVEKENKKQTLVEISESTKKGEYANFVKIQHTAIDFRLDFAKYIADENLLCFISRIFMSPTHAKLFLSALKENIERFEKQYGVINMPTEKAFSWPSPLSEEKH